MEPTDAAVRAKLTNTGLILYTGTNTDCHLPTDIGLSALTTSEGELDPPFEAPGSTGGYGLHVDHDVTSITVSPTPNDPEASIRSDSDADPNTAGIQFNLSGAQNRVEWYVDAKNGLSAQIYLIDVSRAPPPGRYARLRSLELEGATLEDFDSRVYTYTAPVPTTVTETTVTATPFDPDATTVVKLNGVTDSDGTVSLAVGANTITVEVTAEDGMATKTYTVTVTRQAPPLLLVSNLGQNIASKELELGTRRVVQGFTTGPHLHGYILADIKVKLRNDSNSAVTTPVTMSLLTGSLSGNGGPLAGTLVASLTGPSTIPANSTANYSFAATTTVSLDGRETYDVLLEGGTADIIVKYTASDSEDAAGQRGWSFGDFAYQMTEGLGTIFTESDESVLMSVNGAVTPIPPSSLVSNVGQSTGRF